MSNGACKEVVIVGGTLVSGKGVYCKHLDEEHGFKHISYGDVLREEADRQGRDRERVTLIDIAANIRMARGPEGLAELALEQWENDAQQYPGGLAVDGPRAVGDAEGLKKLGGRLVFVDAPIQLRYHWMQQRDRDREAQISFEEFKSNEQREWNGDRTPHGPRLEVIKAMSEFVVENSGTIEDLVSELDTYLGLSH